MTLMADYTITETLQEDDGSALYRATSKRDRHSVLLKTLVQSGRPQSREIARLRHECTLVKGLDLPAVLKVEACDASPEQPRVGAGGLRRDLSGHLPRAALDPAEFLPVAIRMAAALADLHSPGSSTETSRREASSSNPRRTSSSSPRFGLASR